MTADKLTPKRRAFVEAYTGEARGNALEAARMAGYKAPHPEGARLLQNATVAAAIREATVQVRQEAIATREERQTMLTRVMLGIELDRGDEPAMRDRLRALELLGKMQGDFIERVEANVTTRRLPETREEALRRLDHLRGKLAAGEGE